MKLITSLALTALLSTGAAFAASTPTATPASSATPASMSAKHHSAAHCEKQAKEKKLTGDAQKNFVKECKEGKTPS